MSKRAVAKGQCRRRVTLADILEAIHCSRPSRWSKFGGVVLGALNVIVSTMIVWQLYVNTVAILENSRVLQKVPGWNVADERR